MAYAYKSPGVYVEEVPSGNAPIVGAGTSTAAFLGAFNHGGPGGPASPAPDKTVVSCTNFTEFAEAFGDLKYLPNDTGHTHLAQAVYGFFLNGGTHCYVVRIPRRVEGAKPPEGDKKPETDKRSEGGWDNADFDEALALLEPLDDVSIVAAPGMVTKEAIASLIAHCSSATLDRIALLDSPREAKPAEMEPKQKAYSDLFVATSNHAALYYPWLQVANPSGSDPLFVPPSGHLAGIYARVDATRGVHKAPANEAVYGAIGLKYPISRRQQDLLNPDGINCIRKLNGNLLVWGARTLGGDKNGEVKYVPVRRLLNFLRVSVDRGTQWAVFEPNGPDLWAKVIRNLTAFLKGVWAAGALFGRVPEQAFYVKCDEENNPQASRDNGYLNIEIGVAIVRPAEFVVFKISQWSGPQK